jgi:hypothetical protein
MEVVIQQDAVASAADRFLDQMERQFWGRLNAQMESREIERDMEQFRQRHGLLQAEYDAIKDAEKKLAARLRYARAAEAVVIRGQIRALRGKRADVMVRMGEGSVTRAEALEAVEEEVREEEARSRKAAATLTAPVRAAAGALPEAPGPKAAKPARARRGGRAPVPRKG